MVVDFKKDYSNVRYFFYFQYLKNKKDKSNKDKIKSLLNRKAKKMKIRKSKKTNKNKRKNNYKGHHKKKQIQMEFIKKRGDHEIIYQTIKQLYLYDHILLLI